jgi:hypothetical protein
MHCFELRRFPSYNSGLEPNLSQVRGMLVQQAVLYWNKARICKFTFVHPFDIYRFLQPWKGPICKLGNYVPFVADWALLCSFCSGLGPIMSLLSRIGPYYVPFVAYWARLCPFCRVLGPILSPPLPWFWLATFRLDLQRCLCTTQSLFQFCRHLLSSACFNFRVKPCYFLF